VKRWISRGTWRYPWSTSSHRPFTRVIAPSDSSGSSAALKEQCVDAGLRKSRAEQVFAARPSSRHLPAWSRPVQSSAIWT